MSNCDCVIPGPSRLKTCVSQLLSPTETQQMRTSFDWHFCQAYLVLGKNLQPNIGCIAQVITDHSALALHTSDNLKIASLISGN